MFTLECSPLQVELRLAEGIVDSFMTSSVFLIARVLEPDMLKTFDIFRCCFSESELY